MAIDLSRWKPELHPRDSKGRFRDKWGLSPKARTDVDRVLAAFTNTPPLRSNEHAASYLRTRAPKRSERQKEVLRKFLTREGNENIQSTLRAGDKDTPDIKELRGMMVPLEHDLVLSRVVGPDAFGLRAEDMAGVEEWNGQRMMDPAFSPMNIGDAYPIPGPHIEMRVLVPKGTPAIIVGGDGNSDADSRTVILPDGLAVQNIKIQSDGRGGWYAMSVVGSQQGTGTPARAIAGRALPAQDKSPAIDATPDELERRGVSPEEAGVPASQEQPGRFGPTTPSPGAGQQVLPQAAAPTAQSIPNPAAAGAVAEGGPPGDVVQPAKAIKKAQGQIPVGAGGVPEEGAEPESRKMPSRSARGVATPESQAAEDAKTRAAAEREAKARDDRRAAAEKVLAEREAHIAQREQQVTAQQAQINDLQAQQIGQQQQLIDRLMGQGGVPLGEGSEGGTRAAGMTPAQKKAVRRRVRPEGTSEEDRRQQELVRQIDAEEAAGGGAAPTKAAPGAGGDGVPAPAKAAGSPAAAPAPAKKSIKKAAKKAAPEAPEDTVDSRAEEARAREAGEPELISAEDVRNYTDADRAAIADVKDEELSALSPEQAADVERLSPEQEDVYWARRAAGATHARAMRGLAPELGARKKATAARQAPGARRRNFIGRQVRGEQLRELRPGDVVEVPSTRGGKGTARKTVRAVDDDGTLIFTDNERFGRDRGSVKVVSQGKLKPSKAAEARKQKAADAAAAGLSDVEAIKAVAEGRITPKQAADNLESKIAGYRLQQLELGDAAPPEMARAIAGLEKLVRDLRGQEAPTPEEAKKTTAAVKRAAKKVAADREASGEEVPLEAVRQTPALKKAAAKSIKKAAATAGPDLVDAGRPDAANVNEVRQAKSLADINAVADRLGIRIPATVGRREDRRAFLEKALSMQDGESKADYDARIMELGKAPTGPVKGRPRKARPGAAPEVPAAAPAKKASTTRLAKKAAPVVEAAPAKKATKKATQKATQKAAPEAPTKKAAVKAPAKAIKKAAPVKAAKAAPEKPTITRATPLAKMSDDDVLAEAGRVEGAPETPRQRAITRRAALINTKRERVQAREQVQAARASEAEARKAAAAAKKEAVAARLDAANARKEAAAAKKAAAAAKKAAPEKKVAKAPSKKVVTKAAPTPEVAPAKAAPGTAAGRITALRVEPGTRVMVAKRSGDGAYESARRKAGAIPIEVTGRDRVGGGRGGRSRIRITGTDPDGNQVQLDVSPSQTFPLEAAPAKKAAKAIKKAAPAKAAPGRPVKVTRAAKKAAGVPEERSVRRVKAPVADAEAPAVKKAAKKVAKAAPEKPVITRKAATKAAPVKAVAPAKAVKAAPVKKAAVAKKVAPAPKQSLQDYARETRDSMGPLHEKQVHGLNSGLSSSSIEEYYKRRQAGESHTAALRHAQVLQGKLNAKRAAERAKINKESVAKLTDEQRVALTEFRDANIQNLNSRQASQVRKLATGNDEVYWARRRAGAEHLEAMKGLEAPAAKKVAKVAKKAAPEAPAAAKKAPAKAIKKAAPEKPTITRAAAKKAAPEAAEVPAKVALKRKGPGTRPALTDEQIREAMTPRMKQQFEGLDEAGTAKYLESRRSGENHTVSMREVKKAAAPAKAIKKTAPEKPVITRRPAVASMADDDVLAEAAKIEGAPSTPRERAISRKAGLIGARRERGAAKAAKVAAPAKVVKAPAKKAVEATPLDEDEKLLGPVLSQMTRAQRAQGISDDKIVTNPADAKAGMYVYSSGRFNKLVRPRSQPGKGWFVEDGNPQYLGSLPQAQLESAVSEQNRLKSQIEAARKKVPAKAPAKAIKKAVPAKAVTKVAKAAPAKEAVAKAAPEKVAKAAPEKPVIKRASKKAPATRGVTEAEKKAPPAKVGAARPEAAAATIKPAASWSPGDGMDTGLYLSLQQSLGKAKLKNLNTLDRETRVSARHQNVPAAYQALRADLAGSPELQAQLDRWYRGTFKAAGDKDLTRSLRRGVTVEDAPARAPRALKPGTAAADQKIWSTMDKLSPELRADLFDGMTPEKRKDVKAALDRVEAKRAARKAAKAVPEAPAPAKAARKVTRKATTQAAPEKPTITRKATKKAAPEAAKATPAKATGEPEYPPVGIPNAPKRKAAPRRMTKAEEEEFDRLQNPPYPPAGVPSSTRKGVRAEPGAPVRKAAPAKKAAPTKAAPGKKAAPAKEAPAKKAAPAKAPAKKAVTKATPAKATAKLTRQPKGVDEKVLNDLTNDQVAQINDLTPDSQDQYWGRRITRGIGHDSAWRSVPKGDIDALRTPSQEPRTPSPARGPGDADAIEALRRPTITRRGTGATRLTENEKDSIIQRAADARAANPNGPATREDRDLQREAAEIQEARASTTRAVKATKKVAPKEVVKKVAPNVVKTRERRAKQYDDAVGDVPGDRGGLLRSTKKALAEGEPAATAKKRLGDRAESLRTQAELLREKGDSDFIGDEIDKLERDADTYQRAADLAGKKVPTIKKAVKPGEKVAVKDLVDGDVAILDGKKGVFRQPKPRTTFIEFPDGSQEKVQKSRLAQMVRDKKLQLLGGDQRANAPEGEAPSASAAAKKARPSIKRAPATAAADAPGNVGDRRRLEKLGDRQGAAKSRADELVRDGKTSPAAWRQALDEIGAGPEERSVRRLRGPVGDADNVDASLESRRAKRAPRTVTPGGESQVVPFKRAAKKAAATEAAPEKPTITRRAVKKATPEAPAAKAAKKAAPEAPAATKVTKAAKKVIPEAPAAAKKAPAKAIKKAAPAAVPVQDRTDVKAVLEGLPDNEQASVLRLLRGEEQGTSKQPRSIAAALRRQAGFRRERAESRHRNLPNHPGVSEDLKHQNAIADHYDRLADLIAPKSGATPSRKKLPEIGKTLEQRLHEAGVLKPGKFAGDNNLLDARQNSGDNGDVVDLKRRADELRRRAAEMDLDARRLRRAGKKEDAAEQAEGAKNLRKAADVFDEHGKSVPERLAGRQQAAQDRRNARDAARDAARLERRRALATARGIPEGEHDDFAKSFLTPTQWKAAHPSKAAKAAPEKPTITRRAEKKAAIKKVAAKKAAPEVAEPTPVEARRAAQAAARQAREDARREAREAREAVSAGRAAERQKKYGPGGPSHIDMANVGDIRNVDVSDEQADLNNGKAPAEVAKKLGFRAQGEKNSAAIIDGGWDDEGNRRRLADDPEYWGPILRAQRERYEAGIARGDRLQGLADKLRATRRPVARKAAVKKAAPEAPAKATKVAKKAAPEAPAAKKAPAKAIKKAAPEKAAKKAPVKKAAAEAPERPVKVVRRAKKATAAEAPPERSVRRTTKAVPDAEAAAPAKKAATRLAKKAAPAAPAVKKAPAKAVKKAAAPTPEKPLRGPLEPGDTVEWSGPSDGSEGPQRGKVVRIGRYTYIDWESGRREQVPSNVAGYTKRGIQKVKKADQKDLREAFRSNSLAGLRREAQELKVPGYTRMDKAQLAKAVEPRRRKQGETEADHLARIAPVKPTILRKAVKKVAAPEAAPTKAAKKAAPEKPTITRKATKAAAPATPRRTTAQKVAGSKKSRTEAPEGYDRTTVPDSKASWGTKFPDYKPNPFTADVVKENNEKLRPPGNTDPTKYWADPPIDEVTREFHSYEGPVKRDALGRPINPYGRTGVQDRGELGKWGANFAGDAIVTRVDPETGRLQMLTIRRKDGQPAIPGGMVDFNEDIWKTRRRELKEETGVDLDLADSREVYKGYVDDPRNTDNAWMETSVGHKHLSMEEGAKTDKFKPDSEDEIKGVYWADVTPDMMDGLFASHGDFVATMAEQMASDRVLSPTERRRLRSAVRTRATRKVAAPKKKVLSKAAVKALPDQPGEAVAAKATKAPSLKKTATKAAPEKPVIKRASKKATPEATETPAVKKAVRSVKKVAAEAAPESPVRKTAAKKVAKKAIPERLPTGAAALVRLGREQGILGADDLSPEALRSALEAKRRDPNLVPISSELIPKEIRDADAKKLRAIAKVGGLGELEGDTPDALREDLVRKAIVKAAREQLESSPAAKKAARKAAKSATPTKAAAPARAAKKAAPGTPEAPAETIRKVRDADSMKDVDDVLAGKDLQQLRAIAKEDDTPGVTTRDSRAALRQKIRQAEESRRSHQVLQRGGYRDDGLKADDGMEARRLDEKVVGSGWSRNVVKDANRDLERGETREDVAGTLRSRADELRAESLSDADFPDRVHRDDEDRREIAMTEARRLDEMADSLEAPPERSVRRVTKATTPEAAAPAKKAAKAAPIKKAAAKKAAEPAEKFLPPLANGTRRKSATNLRPGDVVRQAGGTWDKETREVASVERDGNRLKVTFTDGRVSNPNPNTAYWMADEPEAPAAKKATRLAKKAAPEAPAKKTVAAKKAAPAEPSVADLRDQLDEAIAKRNRAFETDGQEGWNRENANVEKAGQRLAARAQIENARGARIRGAVPAPKNKAERDADAVAERIRTSGSTGHVDRIPDWVDALGPDQQRRVAGRLGLDAEGVPDRDLRNSIVDVFHGRRPSAAAKKARPTILRAADRKEFPETPGNVRDKGRFNGVSDDDKAGVRTRAAELRTNDKKTPAAAWKQALDEHDAKSPPAAKKAPAKKALTKTAPAKKAAPEAPAAELTQRQKSEATRLTPAQRASYEKLTDEQKNVYWSYRNGGMKLSHARAASVAKDYTRLSDAIKTLDEAESYDAARASLKKLSDNDLRAMRERDRATRMSTSSSNALSREQLENSVVNLYAGKKARDKRAAELKGQRDAVDAVVKDLNDKKLDKPAAIRQLRDLDTNESRELADGLEESGDADAVAYRSLKPGDTILDSDGNGKKIARIDNDTLFDADGDAIRPRFLDRSRVVRTHQAPEAPTPAKKVTVRKAVPRVDTVQKNLLDADGPEGRRKVLDGLHDELSVAQWRTLANRLGAGTQRGSKQDSRDAIERHMASGEGSVPKKNLRDQLRDAGVDTIHFDGRKDMEDRRDIDQAAAVAKDDPDKLRAAADRFEQSARTQRRLASMVEANRDDQPERVRLLKEGADNYDKAAKVFRSRADTIDKGRVAAGKKTAAKAAPEAPAKKAAAKAVKAVPEKPTITRKAAVKKAAPEAEKPEAAEAPAAPARSRTKFTPDQVAMLRRLEKGHMDQDEIDKMSTKEKQDLRRVGTWGMTQRGTVTRDGKKVFRTSISDEGRKELAKIDKPAPAKKAVAKAAKAAPEAPAKKVAAPAKTAPATKKATPSTPVKTATSKTSAPDATTTARDRLAARQKEARIRKASGAVDLADNMLSAVEAFRNGDNPDGFRRAVGQDLKGPTPGDVSNPRDTRAAGWVALKKAMGPESGWDTPEKLDAKLRTVLADMGIRVDHSHGDRLAFDPDLMDTFDGARLNPGDEVSVIKPGLSYRDADGTLHVLRRPTVTRRRGGDTDTGPLAPDRGPTPAAPPPRKAVPASARPGLARGDRGNGNVRYDADGNFTGTASNGDGTYARLDQMVDVNDPNFPDEGIPVRDLKLRKYDVKKGRLTKHDGVLYLVEEGDGPDDQKMRERALKDAQEWHGGLSEKEKRHVKSITSFSGPNPDDAYWNQHRGLPGNVESSASAGNGEIHIYKHGHMGSSPSTLDHELGHLIDGDRHSQRRSDSDQWGRAGRSDNAGLKDRAPGFRGFTRTSDEDEDSGGKNTYRFGLTRYGTSDTGEDFAEAYSAYKRGWVGSIDDPDNPGLRRKVHFRELYPARAAIFDDLFPDNKDKQQREIAEYMAQDPDIREFTDFREDYQVASRLRGMNMAQLRALAKKVGNGKSKYGNTREGLSQHIVEGTRGPQRRFKSGMRETLERAGTRDAASERIKEYAPSLLRDLLHELDVESPGRRRSRADMTNAILDKLYPTPAAPAKKAPTKKAAPAKLTPARRQRAERAAAEEIAKTAADLEENLDKGASDRALLALVRARLARSKVKEVGGEYVLQRPGGNVLLESDVTPTDDIDVLAGRRLAALGRAVQENIKDRAAMRTAIRRELTERGLIPEERASGRTRVPGVPQDYLDRPPLEMLDDNGRRIPDRSRELPPGSVPRAVKTAIAGPEPLPSVISGRQGPGTTYTDSEVDTPADGIPIKDFTLRSGYNIQHGTFFRRDKIPYLIEHADTPEGKTHAEEVQKALRVHRQSLPLSKRGLQRSYVWVRGRNPKDEEKARRLGFDPEDFLSDATSDSLGNVTVYNRDDFGFDGVDQVLDHEFAHTLDHTESGILGRVGSESPEWASAAKSDAQHRKTLTDVTFDQGSGGGHSRIRLKDAKPLPGVLDFVEGVTDYGVTDGPEDFAESFRLYRAGPIGKGRRTKGGPIEPLWFRDIFPERAAILDQKVPDFAEKQLRQIDQARGTDLSVAQRRELIKRLIKERDSSERALAFQRLAKTAPTRSSMRTASTPRPAAAQPTRRARSTAPAAAQPARKAQASAAAARGPVSGSLSLGQSLEDLFPDDIGPEGVEIGGDGIHLGTHEYTIRRGRAWRDGDNLYVIEGTDGRRMRQQLAALREETARLPRELRQASPSLVVVDGDSPAALRRRVNLGIDSDFGPFATAGSRSIVFWDRSRRGPLGQDGQFKPTFRHEASHNSDTAFGGISLKPEWRDAARQGAAGSKVQGFDQWSVPGQGGLRWKEPPREGAKYPDGVTPYATSSVREDWAEAAEFYFGTEAGGIVGTGIVDGERVPIWFRDLFPARAAVLDQYFPEFAAQQLAEIRRVRG